MMDRKRSDSYRAKLLGVVSGLMIATLAALEIAWMVSYGGFEADLSWHLAVATSFLVFAIAWRLSQLGHLATSAALISLNTTLLITLNILLDPSPEKAEVALDWLVIGTLVSSLLSFRAAVAGSISSLVCYAGLFAILGNEMFDTLAMHGIFLTTCTALTMVGAYFRDQAERAQEVLELQRGKMMHSLKMSALGEMSGGIAHEINNPLTIIHGKAGQILAMAQKGELDRETIVSRAERICATALRISKIVNGLRSFARDGDRDPFVPAPVASIVGETIDLCAQRFKNHGVELQLQMANPELSIRCRPVQVSQVLLNLLNNAFDAVETHERRWIRLEVRDLGDVVLLSVTDSGCGVPPQLRERILEPFFSTKGPGKGTGLGLSISKGIAESHGGSLRLNEISPNTCFEVTLPKAQARPIAKAA